MGNSRQLGYARFSTGAGLGVRTGTQPRKNPRNLSAPMEHSRYPSLGIDLEATTQLPTQEVSDYWKIIPSYWEGAIILTTAKSVCSTRVWLFWEMTGYDHKLKMPLASISPKRRPAMRVSRHSLKYGSPSLDHTDQHPTGNRKNQQKMGYSLPEYRKENHSKQPQHQQDYENSPEQGFCPPLTF